MKKEYTPTTSMTTYEIGEVMINFALAIYMWAIINSGTKNFLFSSIGYIGVISFYLIDKKINSEKWTR